MKTRNERRLIELAFGDLPAEAEAQVAADPAAKERLAEYRQMKVALSQMREIPEHQLSTERMRQAILNRGVTRRRRFVFERLGYVAAACAIFFVSYSVARHARTSGSPIVSGPARDVAKTDLPFGVVTPFSFDDVPVARSPRAKHHVGPSSADSEEVGTSRSNQLGSVALYHHTGGPRPPAPKSVIHPKKVVKNPDYSDAPLAENGGDSGVLVIEDASDSSTGLSNAKEVASKSAAVGG